jgi:hypothetical protein
VVDVFVHRILLVIVCTLVLVGVQPVSMHASLLNADQSLAMHTAHRNDPSTIEAVPHYRLDASAISQSEPYADDGDLCAAIRQPG